MTKGIDRFTQEQLEILRGHYGALKLIDPNKPSYAQLCEVLDAASDEALAQLWEAKIKFVGMLARNRLIQRGINV